MATKTEQIARLVDGLAAGGLTVIGDYNPDDRPTFLSVASGDGVTNLRVFCWNVTPGGFGRAEDEYRVQTTRPGAVPLYVPFDGLNLILGYDEDHDLFVAWDAERHPNPGTSSSLQVPLDTLDDAAETGFASRARPLGHEGDIEVVAAFRPELISDYLEVRPDLDASNLAEGTATAAAASGVTVAVEELPLTPERRRAISRVSRLVRNGQFRTRVLGAYDRRCAFCGLGARLVQAAHVRSVASGGDDQIRNGVAACPTHHAAFDLGLIVLEDDLRVVLNGSRLDQFGVSDEDRATLAAGLNDRLRTPTPAGLTPAAVNIQFHRQQWT